MKYQGNIELDFKNKDHSEKEKSNSVSLAD